MAIIQGDCLEVIRTIDPIIGVKAIFGDVPDNMGMKYRTYIDKRPMEDYFNWIRLIVLESMMRCKIFWLSYGAQHDLEFSWMFRDIIKYSYPNWEINKFLWYYRFHQYCDWDCGQAYRPIMRLSRHGAIMYPDSIRIPSVRQEMGDIRAQGPRVPGNVWEIPRVVGNSPERVPAVPTQHPLELMERIVKLSVEGEEIFVDLFGGSGSALRGDIGNRQVAVIEIDSEYCKIMAQTMRNRFKVFKYGLGFNFFDCMKNRRVKAEERE